MNTASRRSLLRGALASAVAASARPVRGEDRAPLRLRRGVNVWPWFSLTREFPSPRIDYDWPPFQPGRPTPTQEDLRRLREIGFDFIRIPVDPGPFLAAHADRRDRLFGNLEEAVGRARSANLSVVVNIQANGATHYWTPERMTGALNAGEFPAYLKLAGEMAARLSRAGSESIALEPINEPLGACNSPDAAEVRLALLAEARAAAPGLTLIASGGCGGLVQGLEAFDPTPLEALQPILFTFHFYEPYLFSHQGAPWMREPVYAGLNAVPWPASAGSLEKTLAAVRARMNEDTHTPKDKKAAAYEETQRLLKQYFDAQPARPFIDQYFAIADRWAKRHNLSNDRMLIGEFGALRSDDRYVAAAAPDRARYITDVRRSAESFGFPWAFWNLFDGMGFMDDQSHAFDPRIIAALGLKTVGD
jgi:hypothetical protein